MHKNIVIYNENLTENKDTIQLYKDFKNKYKVPKLYIENNLSKDKEFKIYNTKQEQDEYITRWLNRSY